MEAITPQRQSIFQRICELAKPALGIYPIPPGKICTQCHGEEAEAVVSYSRDVMVCEHCDRAMR
jgi:hypothetical protein